MSRIRVLLADDEALVRAVIAQFVREDPTLELVGVAADTSEAVEMAVDRQPDVALLDVKMPGGGGVRAASEIRRGSPRTRIVAFTGHADRRMVLDMIRAGAVGYLVKGAGMQEILDAIHRVARDEGVLSSEVASQVVGELAAKLKWEETHKATQKRLTRRVQQALANGSLRSVLQPIVDLNTGRIVGTEALLRVEAEPHQGPDGWLADAAAAGLLAEFQLAALTLALPQAALLPPGVYLSVNLSPEMLINPQILEALSDAAPVDLVIEVTEHAPVGNYEQLGNALGTLRDRGARLAVDDAGAGYASLRHILRLAPDFIKLDISLTRDLHLDRKRRALAAALISFAEEIGATVVAEGIESQAELDALRGLGVNRGQGYLLGRPGTYTYEELNEPVDVGLGRRPGRALLTGLREKIALIQLLYAAIAASEAETVEEALQVALDRICAHTGWPLGHALLCPRPGTEALVSGGIWHVDEGLDAEEFRRATQALRFDPGVGIPGAVLEARGPVLAQNLNDPELPRGAGLRVAGLVSGFGFPLMAGGEVLGALEFFSDVAEPPDSSLLDVIAGFGTQLGRVLERKRAELEILQSHRELTDAQALAHVGSWRSTVPGIAGGVSEEMRRILGLAPGQSPPAFRELLAMVHLDDRARVVAVGEQAAPGREPVEFECRILRPDGALCHIHARIRAFLDPAGDAVALEGTIQDVTELRRAERALRASREEARRIIESAAEAFVALDVEDLIAECNRQAEVMFGWSGNEAIGHPAIAMIAGTSGRADQQGALRRQFAAARKSGPEGLRAELTAQRRDGREIVLEAAMWATALEERQRLNILMHDVTETRHAARLQGELAAIVSSSEDAIVGISPEEMVTSWNRAAEQMYGYTAEEALGRNIEFLTPSARVADERSVRRRVLASRAGEGYETRRLRRDGREVDVSVSVSPIVGVDGRLLGISSVGRDVTDTKRKEAALHRQARMMAVVLENLNEGVIVVDSRGRLLHSNHAAEALVGVVVEDTDPRSWSARYHLHRPDGTLYATEDLPLYRAMHGMGVDLADVLVKRPDCPVGMWLKVTGRPLFDENGVLEGGVIIIADATGLGR